MTVYTVHEPSDAPADPVARAERVEFVKEGVAWWALFFPVLWLLYQRLWIVLIGFLALVFVLEAGLALAGFGDTSAALCALVVQVVFAMEANDLRRWTLSRRGYRTIGAVTGNNRTEAELKFFSGWQGTQARSAPPAPVPAPPPASAQPASAGSEEVVGLFPEGQR